MIVFVGDSHPACWKTGLYEQEGIKELFAGIIDRYRLENILIVNNTWLDDKWTDQLERLHDDRIKFDHMFVYSVIDPLIYPKEFYERHATEFGAKMHWVGNFDGSLYDYNVFAIFADDMIKYHADEVLLEHVKYRFINYNRKPKTHRQQLVRRLQKEGLDKHGIITLGNEMVLPNEAPTADLSYENDELQIPNDVASLGIPEYWNHHFLNIVSETENPYKEEVFVSEKTFKPIIGLRPFVINDDVRTYKWLRDRGFLTFEKYFDFVDLENEHEVHENIIRVVRYICEKDEQFLIDMYRDMLLDLLYNKNRLVEFANEQRDIMKKAGGWEIDI